MAQNFLAKVISESYDNQKCYQRLEIYYGHFVLEGNKNRIVSSIRGLDGDFAL